MFSENAFRCALFKDIKKNIFEMRYIFVFSRLKQCFRKRTPNDLEISVTCFLFASRLLFSPN